MPRVVSPNRAILRQGELFSNSTVEIRLKDGTVFNLTTTDFSFSIPGIDQEFVPGLIRVGDISESLGTAANSVLLTLANTNNQFGVLAADVGRSLELARVFVRRWNRNIERLPSVQSHDHYFSGKAVKVSPFEKKNEDDRIVENVELDIVLDTTAAGVSIATETLSARNGWRFPEVTVPSPPTPSEGAGGIILEPVSGGYIGSDLGERNCFVAGTLIETPKGAVPIEILIERFLKGEKVNVLSFDPKTLRVEKDSVTGTSRSTAKMTMAIQSKTGNCVRATPNERFLTGAEKFTPLRSLQKSSRLFVWENNWAQTTHPTGEPAVIDEPVEVFNLKVRKNHTFIANGFFVHNTKAIQDFFVQNIGLV